MAKAGVITKLLNGINYNSKAWDSPPNVYGVGGIIDASQYRGSLASITTGLPTNEAWFFAPDNRDYLFTWGAKDAGGKAYMGCPPLAAVLNRKTQAYLNGKTYIENTNTGKVVKTGAAARYMKLLSRPNPLQTWKQFEAQQYLYTQMYGWCICLPIMPAGFEKADISYAGSLWNIPPFMVDVKESTKLFYQTNLKGVIESITLNYKGEKTILDLDRIFIFRDFIPAFERSVIFPGSRLAPLSVVINNIMASYNARNELINYAGSQGILSPPTDQSGPVPVKKDDRAQLQADFKRTYGIRRGQARFIITNASLNWQQMGRPTKDLMLFEEVTDNIMQICNSLNYPAPLIATTSGPALSNTEEYKIMLYEDGIIPEALDMYEQWNEFLQCDKEYGLTICKTYDHLPVLQGNKVEEGKSSLYLNQALQIQWLNDQITWNEWREATGNETIEGRDLYYTDMLAKGLITPQKAPAATGANPESNYESDNTNSNAA